MRTVLHSHFIYLAACEAIKGGSSTRICDLPICERDFRAPLNNAVAFSTWLPVPEYRVGFEPTLTAALVRVVGVEPTSVGRFKCPAYADSATLAKIGRW